MSIYEFINILINLFRLLLDIRKEYRKRKITKKRRKRKNLNTKNSRSHSSKS